MNQNFPAHLRANPSDQGELPRNLLDNAPFGLWIHQADGSLGFVNKVFADLVGLPAAEILAMPDYTALFDADTAARCVESRADALATPGPFRREERVGFADGRVRDLEIIKQRMHDATGQPTGSLLCIANDLTERRRAEGHAKLMMAAFTSAREGITFADDEGNIIDVNPRFSEITGYSREEVVGKNPRILQSGRHDRAFYQAMWRSLTEKGQWRGEIWNRRKTGEVYPEILSISRMQFDGLAKPHYVAVFTDISELKAHQESLEYLAHHDALTRLPNRVQLADRMRVAMAQVRREHRLLAVCYLDLDGFKPVNDRHGHHFGDRLLYEMGRRLSDSMRGSDSVARIGGDEFVLLLGGLESTAECQRIVDRMLGVVTQPIVIDGVSLAVSASLGVTLYPDDDADVDTLLRHADHALYQAKEQGRNRYVIFDVSHDYRLRAVREGRQRFDVALASGHLRLYFQPKVDMLCGRLVGAEALVRWQDPDIGLIAPGQFLSFIENTPADILLGEFVIDAALRQIEVWRAEGINLRVSINISPHHLGQRDFVPRLRGFLDAHPTVPAHALEIEILETAAIEDIDHVTALIEACRDMGVDFSIDDFGTGYSSLTYFKHLPVSTLKIDQTFIRNMLDNGDDLAIVEGIINLSHAFRRVVIAEGVETIEHGVRLIDMGCYVAQGYAIAPPMPPEEFSRWSMTWRPDEAWLVAASARQSPEEAEFGVLEHDLRLWLRDLKQHLLASPLAGVPPAALDERNCRFGQWLRGRGGLRYGDLESFAEITTLHSRAHDLAHAIFADVQSEGVSARGEGRLGEIEKLNDQIIARLHGLV